MSPRTDNLSLYNNNRDDWIRTSGPFVPNEVRYQAALHPGIISPLFKYDIINNGKCTPMLIFIWEIAIAWVE